MEATEKDNGLIVCSRVKGNGKPFIKGSVVKRCCDCDNDVYVSPASIVKLNNNKKIKLICLECAAKFKKEDYEILPIDSSQKEELRREMKRRSKFIVGN